MQQLPNNSLRKYPSEKEKGLIGTIIIHSLLLVVLIFVGFTIPPPPDFEEGIMVNFGTDETGFGLIEPAPLLGDSESSVSATISSTSASAPSSARTNSTEEALLTQDSEEAPVVRRVDPNAEIRRREQAAAAAEAQRIRREQAAENERIRQAENERIRAEEAERQRIAAEQQRQSNISNSVRDALAGSGSTGSPDGSPTGLAGSRNVGSTSTSEGVAGGTGNQGVITGSLDSRVRGDGGSGTGNSGTGSGGVGGRGGNRVSYNLGGRSSQSLPNPRYNCQEEGIVIVQVRVNAEGRVTQAEAGRPGSTSLADCLTSAAREAALQTRFSPSDAPVQVGTITYRFVLN